ncbi:MAG: TrmH family RNA methyltransferase, partial [Oscillospiraceae bacterium]|nr:TrmH family RNA methyltransferase [Oscillospiraceae bacterium]
DDFFEKNSGGNYFFFTTKGRKIHSDAEYPDNSFLIFGREDAGLPEELLYAHPDECVRIPMRSTLRSLNLSNSAAIAVYEVLRQWGYPDLETKGQLTKFSW